jgi:hypothetical protein
VNPLWRIAYQVLAADLPLRLNDTVAWQGAPETQF